MKTKFSAILIALLLAAMMVLPAFAQESALTLKLNRDWGYGGFSGDIQGRFTIKASGPDELVSVVFMIDEEIIAQDDSQPFDVQFHTDSYEVGIHTISATGTLADGREISSNILTRDFVAGNEMLDSMGKILIPLFVVIGVITLIGVLGPMMGGKSKQRPIGQYGPAGGTVCKDCQLPFSRNMLSPNLLLGKLSRCPHCGKVQIAKRIWDDALSEAEDRLRADQNEGSTMTEQSDEDRLRDQLDASRFDG